MDQGGKARLEQFEKGGTYVFHGTGYEIDAFEPRQAYNFRNEAFIPDGDPAIWASPVADYAIFMALVNDVNCPAGYHSGSGTRTGSLRFRATRKTLEQLTDKATGYVYVFDRSNFTKRDENEWFSTTQVAPLERVEVTRSDFTREIESMD